MPEPHASFVLAAAPTAHQQLSNGFRAFVAWQARSLMGAAASGAASLSAPGARAASAGDASSSRRRMDDVVLAGMQGLIEAAHRFKVATHQGRGDFVAEPGREDGTSGLISSESRLRAADPVSNGGQVRFITFANFYIRKMMIAAIKDESWNQLYIPRRTLDLKRAVEEATAQLRSEGRDLAERSGRRDAGPSTADVARRLRISEAAVRDVQRVQASANVVSLDPGGGSESNPYEDVQLSKVGVLSPVQLQQIKP